MPLPGPIHPLGGPLRNRLVKRDFELGLEVSLPLVDIGEFGKGPATVHAQVIHARHSVRVHRGLFLFGILAPVALDLDNQVQHVVLAIF